MARFNNPVIIAQDDNGDPVVGAKLTFFETGTSTLKTIYSDSALTLPTANPQTSVDGGRFTGDIFLDGIYKTTLEDENGVSLQPSKDPVGDVVEGQLELWISSNTYNIPEIVLGSDDEYYRSLTDGNQGNDPVSSPINWEQLQFGRVWNTNVTYSIGDSVYGSDGFIYFSRIGSNLANDPTSSPTQWERDHLDNPNLLNNISFTASVSSKALTFAIKTKEGIDPSATDSVKIGYRNSTLTTGDYSIVNGIAATSVVVPDGGTLGFSANEEGLIYLYAINNAGTIELAVAKKALFDENTVHTTTAISASADSDNVLYSTTLRSNVAIRLVGKIRIITGAVAGEWDNAPTELVIWTPSMKKTGDIINVIHIPDTAVATGTTVMPIDDSIPTQSGPAEGDEYLSAPIIPKSTINRLFIEINALVSHSASGNIAGAIFQDSTAGAISATRIRIDSGAIAVPFIISHEMAAGTISSTTFKFRAGCTVAGTTSFNGQSGSRLFGGVAASFIRVTEIQI